MPPKAIKIQSFVLKDETYRVRATTGGFATTVYKVEKCSRSIVMLCFQVGVACLIKPEPPAPAPFIGKIKEIWQTPSSKGGAVDDDTSLVVSWFYRPEEAVGGRKVHYKVFEACCGDSK